jgi:hypothetical protein
MKRKCNNSEDEMMMAMMEEMMEGMEEEYDEPQEEQQQQQQQKKKQRSSSSSSSTTSTSTSTQPQPQHGDEPTGGSLKCFDGHLVLRWVEKYNTETFDGEYSRDREMALKRRIVEYMNRFFVKVSHNT